MPLYSEGMELLGSRFAMLGKGVAAGFVATLVLSLVMVAARALGMVPQLDLIQLISAAAGVPGATGTGWVLHFLIGTLAWGVLFVYLRPLMPGDSRVVQGLSFSVLAWVLMMIAFMPAAGAGLFGQSIGGLLIPVVTFVMHLIYGAVLGVVFAALTRGEALPAATPLDPRPD